MIKIIPPQLAIYGCLCDRQVLVTMNHTMKYRHSKLRPSHYNSSLFIINSLNLLCLILLIFPFEEFKAFFRQRNFRIVEGGGGLIVYDLKCKHIIYGTRKVVRRCLSHVQPRGSNAQIFYGKWQCWLNIKSNMDGHKFYFIFKSKSSPKSKSKIQSPEERDWD